MARQGLIVTRGAGEMHSMALSSRDVHLLDGHHFFKNGWAYRKLFALDFFRGLKTPPLGEVLVTHSRTTMLLNLRELLLELETQRDLISRDYTYGFESEGRQRHGGAQSGFRVERGFGSISVRPAGYCDLTVMDVGPNGRGRIIEIVDMRVRRQYETLEKGVLKVYSRQADVRWFDELPPLIRFLEGQQVENVEILHA